MSFTNVDINVRPIKIAFLIDYDDKKSLKNAILISSVLWGGVYNSIIPVYKRLPRNLMDSIFYKFQTKESITIGYLETFDADYVINYSSLPDDKIPVAKWRVIKESDIFDDSVRRSRARGRGEANYGIGLFEVLDYVEEQEFKYRRTQPLPVFDIQFNSRHSLFLSSIFGDYSKNARDTFMKRYAQSIAIQKRDISLSNYIDVFKEGPVTVRRLCNSYFDEYSTGSNRQDYLFILDVNKWQDIVDYINLKALGLNVIPIPLQICMTTDVHDFAVEFINSHYRKYNQNNVYYETTLLRARNCPETQFKQFADSLKIPQKQGEHKWLYQTWYPRIWDGWTRQHDVAGGYVIHKSASHDVTDSSEIHIPSLKPDFIDDSFHWWRPKFANELNVKTYDSDDYIANAFPLNVEFANRVLGKFASYDEWRFSRRGIVYLPDHQREKIDFKLPSAEGLYDQWQESIGIKAKTSPPGKLAQQIVKKMGVDHLNVLAIEGFAKLMQNLANTKGLVKSISYDKLWGEIQKFTAGTMWFDAEGYFQWLLHKNVIELGADIRCTNCESRSWHSLKVLDKSVTCTVCFEDIEVNLLADPKKQIVWSYKPTGPFTVPDLAQGGYTVALTLNFFAKVRDMNITPRYSFKNNDGSYEADFGLLAAQSWHEGSGIAYLVGECKSFGTKRIRAQFKNSEITKLVKLGKKERNSVIVFATLRRSLKQSDKNRLKRLVYRLREARLRKDESPDVLILTGNELFVQHNLKESWEKLSEKHKSFADRSNYYSVRELCDATQQLYLDVESSWDWFDQRRKSVSGN